MATQTQYTLTREDLSKQYEVIPHSPFSQSAKIGNSGFSESKHFEAINFVIPNGEKLTKELVQKVVGLWVRLNLANQEFVRASAKYFQYTNPNTKPFYQSVHETEPNALRFQGAMSRYLIAMEEWKSFKQQGYSITIIM